MERESQTDAMWRRLLREGELVFIGHCVPPQAFIEEKTDETMVEFLLARKPHVADKRGLKLRVSISIIRPPKTDDDD